MCFQLVKERKTEHGEEIGAAKSTAKSQAGGSKYAVPCQRIIFLFPTEEIFSVTSV